MAGAICIITSNGMKCLSSPIKDHHPGDEDCTLARANEARDRKVAKIRTKLAAKGLKLAASKQDVIASVAELMLAANVGPNTPFTIVRAG